MRFLIILITITYASTMSAQWTTGNEWIGSDPEINSTSPSIELENTSSNTSGLGVSGFEFYDISTFKGYAGWRPVDNRFFFGQSVTSPKFSVDFDTGFTTIAGILDINNTTNTAIRVDGIEMLWYSGTLASWGFGATFNKFAKPITIGEESDIPGSGVGLELSELNFSIDRGGSSSSRFIQFAENEVRKAYLQWTGTDLAIANTEIGDADIFIQTTDDFIVQTGSNTRLQIDENGNSALNTSLASEFSLNIGGDVNITGELTAASDKKLKNNIKQLENATATLNKLNPVSYDFKHEKFPNLKLTDRNKMGLIAQEVEVLLPNLVSDAGTTTDINGIEVDIKSVNYVELIPLLIKAIQEQNQRRIARWPRSYFSHS